MQWQDTKLHAHGSCCPAAVAGYQTACARGCHAAVSGSQTALLSNGRANMQQQQQEHQQQHQHQQQQQQSKMYTHVTKLCKALVGKYTNKYTFAERSKKNNNKVDIRSVLK
jgi:hypothetical protein